MHHSFIDRYSRLESPIHRLEPRAKIIAFMFFVLMVALAPNGDVHAFGMFLILVSSALLMSKVPLGYVLRHSSIILPFVGIAGLSLLFREGGQMVFVSVLAKSWLSALAMLTLVSTTPFPSLLKGLERLGMPSLVLMVVSFMYRYIFLIADEMMRIRAARDSRGAAPGFLHSLRTAGSMIGSLFVRSYERAERAYLSMCSRGFDGSIRTMHLTRMAIRDYAFMLVFCILALGVSLW